MLRRRLLIRIGVLVAVYIAGAVVAIVLLQGVLGELTGGRVASGEAVGSIDAFERSVREVGEALADDSPGAGDRVRLAAEGVRSAYAAVREGSSVGEEGASCLVRIGALLPSIAPEASWIEERSLESWRANAPPFIEQALAEALHLRQIVRADASTALVGLTTRLRTLIVGLTIAALVALNVTIVLLLRTGEMITRPVESLVEASRELARENFGHRVEVEGGGEFRELAESFNQLAEQLRLNEARKMETLQQLAVTLNHELNNVINIIDLQLGGLQRRAGEDRALADRLSLIRENLRRMARTVASLKDVRRIVLTEYADGRKMLDLARSTGEGAGDGVEAAGPEPVAGADEPAGGAR
jgi:signal transduction histidine kinase